MVWFNCAAIELRVGRGVKIVAEMRDFSLLHDLQIGSGTLLAYWFGGWIERRGKSVLFNDAVCW